MTTPGNRPPNVVRSAFLFGATFALSFCGDGVTRQDTAAASQASIASARCTSPTVDPTTPAVPVARWTLSDHAITSDHISPYMTAPWVQQQNAFTYDQAPSWSVDGRVLANPNGDRTRIEISNLDGSDPICLTCNQPNNTTNGQPAHNGLAQARPQGDWILFESTRGHILNYGGDGLGGIGDALWVMRSDGSCPVQLTGIGLAGEATNDFHAYWSPDGNQIVWTHISGNLLVDSLTNGTEFTMRLADFVDDGANPPHLANQIIVGPRGENYETQPWAPDGSGFLFQYSTAGQNQEVFYMRLYGQGATPLTPYVQQLTDGNPAWDEQALFTPDMSAVLYMSSRDCPTCLYNNQTTLSHLLGVPQLPLGLDGVVYIPLFFAATASTLLLPPTLGGFKSDLYVLDLHTRQLRRLTDDNGVIPEFYFDRQGRTLFWSENHVYGTANIPGVYTNNTMTAYFAGLPSP
jgi:Tol biopolymer transport system component